MRMSPPPTRLEPLRPAVTAATLVHAVIGLAVFWWASQTGALIPPQQALVWSSPAEYLGEGLAPAVQPTAAVQKVVPAPAAALPAARPAVVKAIAVTPEMLAKLTAPQSSSPSLPPVPAPSPVQSAAPMPEPPSDVTRTITVSRPAAAEPPARASLLDMAHMDALAANEATNMDAVDRAIILAFKTHWIPPASAELDPDRCSVGMDVAIGRTGRVLSFKPTQPSGHAALDASVLTAANQVSSIGIPLPASYVGDRYEPRLNFHAE